MRTKKGSYRRVFIFKTFVIKFPRIFLWKAVKDIWGNALKGRKFLLHCLKRDTYGYLLGPKAFLFRGVLENLGEFCFYYKNKSKFLLPTCFSFFGLLNIQKAGGELKFLKKEGEEEKKAWLNFWSQIQKTTNMEAFNDSHHFSNPKNFCEENGKLKIVDYGSPYTQEVLEKYGDKIFEEFDLNKC